ncbi:hypothetical protein [Leptolyngbya sp. FACHB-1624]|uniref:hypothetical protein n=1 Tax=Leptolyngbya sp. FACHB-1624 TaxID=2692802 RepID=UPI0039EC11F4
MEASFLKLCDRILPVWHKNNPLWLRVRSLNQGSCARGNVADKASLVSKTNCSLRWNIGENIAPSYSIPYGGKPSYRIERQFHIGQSWGIHETTVGHIVRKIENILIQSGEFCLPGKKALHSAQTEWNILVVDVSESPIERPKKNNDLTTVASRNGTR